MKSLYLFFVILFLGYSCSKNENPDNLYKFEKFDNKKIAEKLKDKLSAYCDDIKPLIDFDFNNLTLGYYGNNETGMIMANQVNFNNNQTTSYSIGFTYAHGEIGNALIVKLNKINEVITQVEYYDLSNTLIFATTLNFGNSTSSINYICPPVDQKMNCGNLVAECLVDAYSNHGWASVAAWGVTCFYPETFLVMATACAAMNC